MPGDRTRSASSVRARARPPVKVAIRQENGPRCVHRSPNHAMWCENYATPILPVHAEAVAALDAFHIFGLSRYVLTLVTPGAHEMGLVHYAPGLRSIFPDFEIVLGNAHFDLGARPIRSTACRALRRRGTTRLAAGPRSRPAHPARGPIRIRPWLTPFPRGCLPARARGLPPAGRPDTSFLRT